MAAINPPPVPLGYRFKPTDQELIGFFLYKLLVLKQPLIPPNNKKIILDYNLYGIKLEPWEIWTEFGGDDQVGDQGLYFFCQLKKLHAKSSRIDRKIGLGGTWSEGSPSTLVEEDPDHNGKPIGLKRKLRYENRDSEQDGKWFLDEYSLFRCDRREDEKGYDFDSVICRLRKNERLSGEKRKCRSSSKASSKKKPENKKLKRDQLPSNSTVANNIVVEEPQTQSTPSSDPVVVSGFEKDYQIADKNYDYHDEQLVGMNYWPDDNILINGNASSDNTVDDHGDYFMDPKMSMNIEELLAEIDRESALPPPPQIVDQTPEALSIPEVDADGVLQDASNINLTLLENSVDNKEASNLSLFENTVDNQPFSIEDITNWYDYSFVDDLMGPWSDLPLDMLINV